VHVIRAYIQRQQVPITALAMIANRFADDRSGGGIEFYRRMPKLACLETIANRIWW
jgi:hypothetical protein